MKRAHMAFFSFPHHPHVNPTLPIVRTLVRRGHRVTYATSNRFAQRLRDIGAEVIIGPEFNVPKFQEVAPDLELDKQPICRMALGQLALCERFYESDRPDLIVYDLLAFAGRILSHRWSVPAVQTSPTFAHDKSTSTARNMGFEYFQQVLTACDKADNFLRRHGVASADEFLFHREGLNLYLFPKALQPNSQHFGSDCFYAGRLAGEQLYFGDWRRTDRGDLPLVLIATSTTYLRGPDFFKMCADALSGLPWHAVLSIGDYGDAAALGPLPLNMEIVQNNSHVQILRHASLSIGLGGILSVSEAVYHGVPTIALSCGIPENEWEQREFEHLGIRIHVPKNEMNAEKLRRAVIRASDDIALQNRVNEVQHAVRREPGAEETANMLEEYLESRTRSH
jgi:MGT family glycosyltransferase